MGLNFLFQVVLHLLHHVPYQAKVQEVVDFFSAPLEAHSMFEKCCLAGQIDFWQPFLKLWRGARRHPVTGGGISGRREVGSDEDCHRFTAFLLSHETGKRLRIVTYRVYHNLSGLWRGNESAKGGLVLRILVYLVIYVSG